MASLSRSKSPAISSSKLAMCRLAAEWVQDPRHRPKNGGGRWYAPDGSGLEFHPGRPGVGGDQDYDHWHRVVGRKKQKRHLRPGDEVPDPAPVCEDPNKSEAPDDSGPTDEYANEFDALPPWILLLPFGPLFGPAEGIGSSPWLVPAFGL